MPWCIAVDCNSNTFKSNRDKNVSFYGLPKDENLKKRWLQNIKRENLPKDKKICHLHFEEHCFKRDLKVYPWYLFKVRCVRVGIYAFGINYKMFLFKQWLQDSEFKVYLYHSFSFAFLERTPWVDTTALTEGRCCSYIVCSQ